VINSDKIFTEERGEAITRLERLCRRLRLCSILIISITFANTTNSLAIAFIHLFSREYNFVLITTSIFFSFCVLMFAVTFDYLKKEGNAYFEELSDELHGAKISNKEDVKKSSMSDEQFSLGARIIMRNYSNCSSLPLIPGRYGPALMVGVNLILPYVPFFWSQ
jgi:hypothetical protein